MKLTFIILFVLLLFGACKYGIVKKTKSLGSLNEDVIFTKNILEKSETGYWLVARGYKVTAHIVATATITDYSHAAILDLTTKSVIEADATGVHEIGLDKFVNHSFRITIVKPAGYTNKRGEIAVASARNNIGKPYDFSGTIGINDSSKYYCSELAVYCYTNIKDSVKLPSVIKPSYLLELGITIYETSERKGKNKLIVDGVM